MAPYSNTLAWKIPRMEEPGGLQSMGSLRVRRDWATSLSLFIFMHWRRKWQPTPVLLPGESQGAWWASVYGVTQSRTRLKWLSSRSSSSCHTSEPKIAELTSHHTWTNTHCFSIIHRSHTPKPTRKSYFPVETHSFQRDSTLIFHIKLAKFSL